MSNNQQQGGQYGEQHRTSERWDDTRNVEGGGGYPPTPPAGGYALPPHGGQYGADTGVAGRGSGFGSGGLAGDPVGGEFGGADTGRRGQAYDHGGRFGANTGGDYNAGDPTTAPRRAGAGRDDREAFGNDAPGNYRGGGGGSGGNALPGEERHGADRSGSPGGGGHNHPGMGDRIMGNVEKAAGRVTGNTNMTERGQMRKTGGGPQADDTLL